MINIMDDINAFNTVFSMIPRLTEDGSRLQGKKRSEIMVSILLFYF